MIKSRLIQSNQHTIHSQEEPRENKESTGHHSLQQMTVKHTQAINVMVQRAMAEGMSVLSAVGYSGVGYSPSLIMNSLVYNRHICNS